METSQFKLDSPAFHDGQPIPETYTEEGKNLSPPLYWSHVPASAKELALICEDPDAPKDAPFIHWVIYKIPASETELGENVQKAALLKYESGLLQGKNSAGQIGYIGPKPPAKTGAHRYYFRLFALDIELSLPPGISKDELMEAMTSHIIGEADLMGKYEFH